MTCQGMICQRPPILCRGMQLTKESQRFTDSPQYRRCSEETVRKAPLSLVALGLGVLLASSGPAPEYRPNSFTIWSSHRHTAQPSGGSSITATASHIVNRPTLQMKSKRD